MFVIHVCSTDILGIIALIPTRYKRVSDSWPHPDPSVSLRSVALLTTRERRAWKTLQSIVKRCIGVISRGIDSSGRPMMYTTVHRRMPHVFYMHYMHARVGRCMRATKEKWNNDVSFNASVVIFYLRITRDNGRLAYEYVPRPWYRVTHACARHIHTRARARKTQLHLYYGPCSNVPLYSMYTCREHAYIHDTPLTFHPAAVSFGDDAVVLCKWMQNDINWRDDRRGVVNGVEKPGTCIICTLFIGQARY